MRKKRKRMEEEGWTRRRKTQFRMMREVEEGEEGRR